MQKKPFHSIVKILNRLTYPSGNKKIGRIGKVHFSPVHFKEGLVDYLLKEGKLNLLNIAWLASNIRFQDPEVSDCPISEKLP